MDDEYETNNLKNGIKSYYTTYAIAKLEEN